jgi:serine/threonine-protein kinase RsbT
MSAGPRSLDIQISCLAEATVAAAAAVRLARAVGASRRVAGEIGIITSELATNAVRHAGGGVLTLSAAPGRIGVECADRGPGDPSVLTARAATARLTTKSWPQPAPSSGGLGHGLGAVARLADRLDITPRAGGGIVVRAERRADPEVA